VTELLVALATKQALFVLGGFMFILGWICEMAGSR
jgi:hypothetical protein